MGAVKVREERFGGKKSSETKNWLDRLQFLETKTQQEGREMTKKNSVRFFKDLAGQKLFFFFGREREKEKKKEIVFVSQFINKWAAGGENMKKG